MISLIILAQGDMGEGLLHAVEHVLGKRPAALEIQPIDYRESQDTLGQALAKRITRLDQGQGVLILADIFGSSHTNVACQLLQPGRVELVSGVNLPMLVRVLNYRHLSIESLLRKALSGGTEGIVHATPKSCSAGGGR